MKSCRSLLIFIFFFSRFSTIVKGIFTEVSFQNFDKLTDGRSYLVLLFYTDGCEACTRAVVQFQEAAKSFDKFEEVLFGKVEVTKDRVLALRFKMDKVPTILLFPYRKQPLPFLQAIKADDIVGAVTASRLEGRLYRGVHMNEHLLGQHFTDIHSKLNAKEITLKDFKKEALDNKKYVLVALFTEGCGDECTTFDMVNNVFRDDENIALLKMDVAKAPDFAQHYQMTHNPTLLWFPPEDKKFGKIYGGTIDFQQIVSFLNSETGAERAHDGRIKEDAGRIEEFDKVLETNILDLIKSKNTDHILKKLKILSKKIKAPKRFVDYYIKIIENSVKLGTIDQVLETENEYITKRLSKKKLSIRERDEWTKFRNIISGLVDMAAQKLMSVRVNEFEEKREKKRRERETFGEDFQERHKVPLQEEKGPVEWVSHNTHDEL